MNLESKDERIVWYNNPVIVSNLVLLVVVLIIIFSQSLGIYSDIKAWEVFKNVINLNSIYILVFLYFISIKTKFGRKYFNYLNVILIFIHLLIAITSFLSLIQQLTIVSFILFVINIFLFLFQVHTLLKDTNIWNEFNLFKSPFNEVEYDFFFIVITLLSILYFVINMVITNEFSSVVLTLFITIYNILFSRFLLLYGNHREFNKNKIKKKGAK